MLHLVSHPQPTAEGGQPPPSPCMRCQAREHLEGKPQENGLRRADLDHLILVLLVLAGLYRRRRLSFVCVYPKWLGGIAAVL